jgi:ribosome-binding protein aMBF1 (putative translation factor)
MKTTHLSEELYPTTTTCSENLNDFTNTAKVITPDFDGYVGKKVKIPDNHSSFDELIQEWEQQDQKKVKEARAWLVDAFYTEDGDTIKTIRLRKGWSQTQLADAIGSKQPHIVRIERGTENVVFHTMLKLCNVLEIDMNTLAKALCRQEELNFQKHNEKN